MPGRAEYASLQEYLQQVLTPHELSRLGIITFNHWSFAVGTVIETVLEARSLGSSVTVGFWADSTPLPDVGWRSSRLLAHLVGSRTRDEQAEQALLDAGVPSEVFVRPPIRQWHPVERLPALPKPLTRANIRDLTYRGSAMGRAILQVHPDDQTPYREGHIWPRRWVQAAMRTYAWAYDQADALIRERDLRTVVVYNGRFTHDMAVDAAAHAAGIKTLYYDTGGYQTDFDLTEATTHDWAHLQGRMAVMYDAWDPSERDRLGGRWFEDRRHHTDVNNTRFTEEQVPGHVEGLPDAERLVVFFSSSGDEIAELDIDWADYLDSQENALALLAEECRQRPGTALVVRTHPHMRLKPGGDLDDWMGAVASMHPDVHFDPHSTIDSYALADRADVVFTYGSTAGVEAAYFGRPVVVMGPSAYDLLGCARRVRTAEEIGQAIDTPPEPQPGKAIPYGLMMQRRGFTYRHARALPDDSLGLGESVITEASVNAQKASDAWRKLRFRRLTSR